LGTSASVSAQVARQIGTKNPEAAHQKRLQDFWPETKKLKNRRFPQNDLFQPRPARRGLPPIAG
jgi:hypothetical protein